MLKPCKIGCGAFGIPHWALSIEHWAFSLASFSNLLERYRQTELRGARVGGVERPLELRVPEQDVARNGVERVVDVAVVRGVENVEQVDARRERDPLDDDVTGQTGVESSFLFATELAAARAGRDVVETIAVAIQLRRHVGGIGKPAPERVDGGQPPVVENGPHHSAPTFGKGVGEIDEVGNEPMTPI